MTRPSPIIWLIAAGLACPAFAQAADQPGRTPQQEYRRGYAATPMPARWRPTPPRRRRSMR